MSDLLMTVLRIGLPFFTIMCLYGLYLRTNRGEKGCLKDYFLLAFFCSISILYQFSETSDQFAWAVILSAFGAVITIIDALWWFAKITHKEFVKLSIGLRVVTVALILCVFSISALFLYAEPMRCKESDGSSCWKIIIPVTNKKSLISFDTRANVFWNGSLIEIGDTKVATNKWLELQLWNGLGITEVQVIGQQSGEKLYPKARAKANSMKFENEELKIAFQLEPSRTHNSRYQLVSLKPTTIDKAVIIKIKDKLGNISSSTLNI